ncbi:zinc finger matrin-type protein 2 [Condylostylus longicornis]|uniref:zinc finger matrin-type protein 2 n=1 Tax=Condylostylus longicornis TaxID=2530218 RepID=UPI00244DC8B6|nr:zinc finger matrin-type protein 2 [Condylostylus longicornis]
MSMRPDDHRRKWDRAEYQRLAQDRIKTIQKEDESGEPVQRENLKIRDYKVDLDSKLGKSVVISKNTPTSQSGGYYCNVCDCVVKDSINFLDHINGKKHQRNLGMSMKVERSTVDQVKERFKINKKKMEEKKKEYDLDKRLREAKEEEERYKEHKKEKRKERKRKADDNIDGDDTGMPSDIAAIMGFSGFGGSRKNT